MAFLIGTDEAGYGPNLGPLVIAASVWQTREARIDKDLYADLAPWVTDQPASSPTTLAIADSKRLYHGGGELDGLERGVFAAMSLVGPPPATWRELLAKISPIAWADCKQLPWYSDFDRSLPTGRGIEFPADWLAAWKADQRQKSIRLVAIRARLVFPPEFNLAVTQLDSKGTLLSHATLDLIAELIAELPNESLRIVCDKHGGRNHYGPLLQPRFEDRLVRVVQESRALSCYEVGMSDRSIRISFQARGETFLPSALASMMAKYVRELCMQAVNQFWRQHLPDLKPTAGYPADARRFRQAIEPVRRRLGIDESQFWRCR